VSKGFKMDLLRGINKDRTKRKEKPYLLMSQKCVICEDQHIDLNESFVIIPSKEVGPKEDSTNNPIADFNYEMEKISKDNDRIKLKLPEKNSLFEIEKKRYEELILQTNHKIAQKSKLRSLFYLLLLLLVLLFPSFYDFFFKLFVETLAASFKNSITKLDEQEETVKKLQDDCLMQKIVLEELKLNIKKHEQV
jgi:hypothetical protein